MRKEFKRQNQNALRRDLSSAYGKSGLTQKEFARQLPLNPKTNKPYNDRTIRKWLGGERSTVNLRQQLRPHGGVFVQTFTASDGSIKSFRLRTEKGHNLLETLTTPEGKQIRLEAVNRRIGQLRKVHASIPDDYTVTAAELGAVEPANRFSHKYVTNLKYLL